MNSRLNPLIGRRALLRGLTLGAAGAASGVAVNPASADTESYDEKRKARYQANSVEIQTFYRVNRYPGS